MALAALVACAGVFWAIWSVPLVLTNDGPEAVLTAHMEAHYDDPGSLFARQFSIGFGLSGRGYSVLYRPLAALLSWPSSYRASQVVIVLALALAVAWLSRALSRGARDSRDARFAPLLGFAIAFSWPFYMGFYAFTISMTVGLMVVAFVVSRSGGLTLLEKAAVTTALIVQLFMHGFAVFLSLGLVALVVTTRALMQRKETPPAQWRRAALGDLVWLFVSALPSVVILLIMRSAQTEMASLAGSGTTEWAKLSEWVRVLPRLAVAGSTPLGAIVIVLAVVAIVRTALRLRRDPEARRPEAVAVLIGAVALLVGGMVLPLNIPGWQFFAPRFFTTGLALSLSLLGTEKLSARRARVFDVGIVALVGAALLNARAVHRHLATACEDAIAGLEHRIERSYFQLPVTFDSTCGLSTDETQIDVPYSKPLLHFYAFFPVLHGGSVPYGFFGPAAVHAFVPRPVGLVPVPQFERYWGLAIDDPRLTHPKPRAQLVNELSVFGTTYENILFFGANAADRALLLDRGYVVDYEHGSFVNAHFAPCAVEVVSDVMPADAPVLVTGGLQQDELWKAQIAPRDGDRHGGIKASLKMLCGDVWVRVQWQNSDRRCANADAQGRINVHADHDATTAVVCDRSTESKRAKENAPTP